MAKKESRPPVATSNSSTCGRVKFLHPGWRDDGTLAKYVALSKHGARVFHGDACGRLPRPGARVAVGNSVHMRDGPNHVRLATRAAASLRRQLLPSNLSRWP